MGASDWMSVYLPDEHEAHVIFWSAGVDSVMLTCFPEGQQKAYPLLPTKSLELIFPIQDGLHQVLLNLFAFKNTVKSSKK